MLQDVTSPVDRFNYRRVTSFSMIVTVVALMYGAMTLYMQANEQMHIPYHLVYYTLYVVLIALNICMFLLFKYNRFKRTNEKVVATIFYIYCTSILLLSALIASFDVLLAGHFMIFIVNYFLISMYFVSEIRLKLPVTILSWSIIIVSVYDSKEIMFEDGMYIVLAISIVVVGFLSQIFINKMTRKMIAQQEFIKIESERAKRLTKELETVNVELRKMALFDPLTDLLNRRALEQYLERKLQVKSPLTCTTYLVDVDFFKQYNDYYGHRAGDDVLVRIGRALKDITVQEDICIARWGGEEFLIVSTRPAGQENIEQLAKRFVEAIASLQIDHVRSTIHPHVTISVGAYRDTIEQMDELTYFYERADEVLYEAKHNGRNQYVIST